ncbi:MAG: NAD(+) synthase [Deltaproteobacteria bacterium RIFOXYA12_FULL_58_15]|nr:MAG: NAD(+) synthase [Deltaproteobacteria bacterium RIFOXYA12_FULL_58_15]OGR14828.1 MAG: NAD(+) synthase [Deltaproteobacteria bacterium RIFOXYB12_FULL_58_9]
MRFLRDVLNIDVAAEAERICNTIRKQISENLKRRGAVVGLSGGIDSSTVGALCVKALGPKRVRGLLMHERDSSADTRLLSSVLVKSLGIQAQSEEITGILEGFRCYERRDEAIRSVVPEFAPGWKSKIVLPLVEDNAAYNIYSVVVESPTGEQKKVRLSAEAYLGIVAATNFKQRTRKTLEYYWADRLNFAVAGTPNRLEYDQGFFVKLGDGAADVKPIAHLYKTQVYAIAKHLGVPAEICNRPPTTDTYTLAQGQDEFYFSLPYDRMDLCLWAKNHDVPPTDVAKEIGLTTVQVERVYMDIDRKRSTTEYLHAPPLLVEEVFA